MKYTVEDNLRNFKFWNGAADNAAELTTEQLDALEDMLEDMYPEGMTDTQINDLLWFDFDTVKEWLGIEDENEEFDLSATLEVAAEDGYDKIRQFFIDKFANGQNPQFDLDWEELYNECWTDWKFSSDFTLCIERIKGNVDEYTVSVEMGKGPNYNEQIALINESMSTYDHNEAGMVIAVQDCLRQLITDIEEDKNEEI